MNSIWEMKNIDCSIKEHRKKLLLFVMKLMKVDEKPSKEELRAYCKRLKERYNVDVEVRAPTCLFPEKCFWITTHDKSILTCFYITDYEAMLKFIGMVYFLAKDKRLKRVK